MKAIFLTTVITVGCALIGSKGFAQNSQPRIQNSQEIIIRKNGQTPSKMTIEIDSNHITVNGKPLSAFNGDVTVRERKFMGGRGNGFFDNPGGMMNLSVNSDKAFLGVLTAKTEKGAVIKNVINESSAKKAGLQEGDIITKVNDKTITTPDDLREAIGSFKAGDKVTVTYLRNDKKKTLQLELGKTQGNTIFLNSDTLRGMMGTIRPFEDFNFRMPQAPGSFNFNYFNNRPKLGLRIEDTETGSGVKVSDVEQGSAADKAGIKKDDVITEVNGQKINDVNDVRSQLNNSENKNDYKIKAKRNSKEMDFDVHIPKILKSINI